MIKQTSEGLKVQQSGLAAPGKLFMNFVLLLLCLGVFWFFLSFSGINNNERALFANMLSGSAERPFVTRALIPWLTKSIAAIFPQPVHAAASEAAGRSIFLGGWLTHVNVPVDLALEGIISLIIQFCCLVGFAFTIKALILRVYKAPAFFPYLAAITALFGLLPMLLFGYIYDLPNLFLCTLALYMIALQRLVGYAIVFILAILNKETAAILIVPSLLLFWEIEHPSLAKLLTGSFVQLAAYFAIRLPINALYRGNPGVAFEMNLDEHLYVLVNHPILWVLSVLLGLGLVLLIFARWREKPALAMLGALPGLGLIILFVVSGFPFEIRVFYEVYTAGFLGLIYTLASKKIPIQSKPPLASDILNNLPRLFGRQEKAGKA